MKKELCKIISVVLSFLTVLAMLAAATVTASGALDLSNIARYFLIGFALVFGIAALIIAKGTENFHITFRQAVHLCPQMQNACWGRAPNSVNCDGTSQAVRCGA